MKCLQKGIVKLSTTEEYKINPFTISDINKLCAGIDDKYEKEIIKNDMLYDEIDIS